MINKVNKSRNKWLHLRLTNKEYELIQEQFSQTTDLKVSDFTRKKLLGKLMIGSYRDASMDAFMEELISFSRSVSVKVYPYFIFSGVFQIAFAKYTLAFGADKLLATQYGSQCFGDRCHGRVL